MIWLFLKASKEYSTSFEVGFLLMLQHKQTWPPDSRTGSLHTSNSTQYILSHLNVYFSQCVELMTAASHDPGIHFHHFFCLFTLNTFPLTELTCSKPSIHHCKNDVMWSNNKYSCSVGSKAEVSPIKACLKRGNKANCGDEINETNSHGRQHTSTFYTSMWADQYILYTKEAAQGDNFV